MVHFSKKALACAFAKDLGFDYAHRDGLFGKQALYVADVRWWHRREKKRLMAAAPVFIIVEGGKPRKLNVEETMGVLGERS